MDLNVTSPTSTSLTFPLLLDYSDDDLLVNESSQLHPRNLSSGQVEEVIYSDDTVTVSGDLEENFPYTVNTSLPDLGFGVPNTPLSNKIVHYSFGTALTLIGIAGATGNGLVLYVFTRYRRLRGGGVPLILSLAAGDFSVSILHIMPAYSSFKETWSFGTLGCEMYAAAVGLCGMASLLTLSVIAAERFCVIMGSPITCLSSKKEEEIRRQNSNSRVNDKNILR